MIGNPVALPHPPLPCLDLADGKTVPEVPVFVLLDATKVGEVPREGGYAKTGGERGGQRE